METLVITALSTNAGTGDNEIEQTESFHVIMRSEHAGVFHPF